MDAAEFAEYLRAERERRRLTLEQVADETKIASRHLEALERGDVRSWPGGMYRRAMMRAYAESIGVDRESALRQFEQVFDAQPRPSDAAPAAVATPRLGPVFRWRPARRHALAAGCSILGIVALAIVWQVAGALTAGDATVATTNVTPTRAAASPPAATKPQTPAAPPSVPEAAATTGSAPVRPLATEATLVVESDPPGARVTVNGIGWGETPITIRHLEFGSKRIRLTLQDHLSEERIVQFGPERPAARVRVALRARN